MALSGSWGKTLMQLFREYLQEQTGEQAQPWLSMDLQGQGSHARLWAPPAGSLWSDTAAHLYGEGMPLLSRVGKL